MHYCGNLSHLIRVSEWPKLKNLKRKFKSSKTIFRKAMILPQTTLLRYTECMETDVAQSIGGNKMRDLGIMKVHFLMLVIVAITESMLVGIMSELLKVIKKSSMPNRFRKMTRKKRNTIWQWH
jgi:hypothetical protein